MEQFVELLKQVNIVHIFVIFAGFWVFYSRLDKKIEKLDERFMGEITKQNMKIEKLDERLMGEITKQSMKIDKLSEKVEDVDRRLCRIEGSLATHSHCLFNQTASEKKVN